MNLGFQAEVFQLLRPAETPVRYQQCDTTRLISPQCIVAGGQTITRQD